MKNLAGKQPPQSMLADIPSLISDYYSLAPDLAEATQLVSFGTSGHRGSSSKKSFNEPHILAIAQAVADYRQKHAFTGPLFLGRDTHALSAPAHRSVIEVLSANGVHVKIEADDAFVPTPVISHAILNYNLGRTAEFADGIVITPSHNPPDNGGIKYNPPHGGPADSDATQWIAARANDLLKNRLTGVKRLPYGEAIKAANVERYDYRTPYVEDLRHIIDFAAIRKANLHIGADVLGGAGMYYYEAIAKRYHLNIESFHTFPDPTFSFMTLDWDGKIRMDCSSKFAMAGLVALKDQFDIAFGNDPDFDRHGIVTPQGGLMNPNHYLAVAIDYLLQSRTRWSPSVKIGKTAVSSSMIDRVVASHGRTLFEVPVGFKYFVQGLYDGSIAFGGEESAGASFLRFDGTTWSTDKDGILLALLAAEITAVTGMTPDIHYRRLTRLFGKPDYERIDAAATPAQKSRLGKLSPEEVKAKTLAGEPILDKLTRAPGDHAPIGGLKVVTENGWFAARPSGTEDVYKIYAESFKGPLHLKAIQEEAKKIVSAALG